MYVTDIHLSNLHILCPSSPLPDKFLDIMDELVHHSLQ
jgi:hypothetical protein